MLAIIPKSDTAKLFLLSALVMIVLGSVLGISIYKAQQANAYNRGNIMSNSVYLNKNSMSEKQIQKFLESKKSKLATYTAKGTNIPSNKPASYIIWKLAHVWGINPQVILATLQKESSLITMQNPESWRFRTAMGYGCPDKTGCNDLYYGFVNQVNMASYQFRYNYEALRGNSQFTDGDGDLHGVGAFACNGKSWAYSNALRPGNKVKFYGKNSGDKDTTITIANEATASFLCYTPHVGPLSQTGYSGSDNLVSAFDSWFGYNSRLKVGVYEAMVDIDKRHTSLGGKTGFLGESIGNIGNSGSTYWQRYDNGYIIWSPQTGAWESYGPIRNYWRELDYQNGKMGRPVSKVVTMSDGGQHQRYEHGYIIGKASTGFWESKGSIRDKWQELGYQNGRLGYPKGPEVKVGNGSYSQKYENGYIVGNWHTGYWISAGAIRDYWIANGGVDSRVGMPTGPETNVASGIWKQSYKRGLIIGGGSTGYWTVTGSIQNKYASLGEYSSDVGLPTANEVTDGHGRWYQEFKNGVIAGMSGSYYIVSGSILQYWMNEVDGHAGIMGTAVENSGSGKDGGKWQRFENGYIIVNPNTNETWESKGAIRRYWKELGYQNGVMGYPTGPEVRHSNGEWTQSYENGTIHHLGHRDWHTAN